MVHPQVKDGYHEIRATWHPHKEVYDMFVGKFKSDKKYHLLGYRPRAGAYLFSSESESNQDIGTLTLPRRKTSLGDLVLGDIIEITPTEPKKKGEKWRIKYLRSA
ncbi:MAG: hypothetical protein AABW50_05175 [Nanoarchaeota archaeon]